MLYPFIEARHDQGHGQSTTCSSGPATYPTRTALGAMAIAFYLVLLLSGGNDVIADKFNISLNAMTWAGRIGLLSCRRWPTTSPTGSASACSSTTARCWRTAWRPASSSALPDGQFVEVHQPLGPADAHGHSALDYGGTPVPKKMNRLGALPPTVRGFFFPVEKPAPPTLDAPPAVDQASERDELTSGRH